MHLPGKGAFTFQARHPDRGIPVQPMPSWSANCRSQAVKDRMTNWVRPMDSLRLEDVGQAGGKNASLGELLFALRGTGIRVPGGFAVTTAAYSEFVRQNKIDFLIRELEPGPEDSGKIRRISERIRSAFREGTMPQSLRAAILTEYRALTDRRRGRLDVAVRSSATTEDLPKASFAGQQDSFLNIRGDDSLIERVQECFGSLFTDRAISYRRERGFDPSKSALSVGVQAMIRSDLASSGVLFTLDPESGDRRFIVINSSYGLGEPVVQGSVVPDEFVVFKTTLSGGFAPIVRRQMGEKGFKRVGREDAGEPLLDVPLSDQERETFSLRDAEILELARAGIKIEAHYSSRYERPCPMDIEWAKDGPDGELYVVQARPETVHSSREPGIPVIEQYFIEEAGPVLTSGRAVGQGIRCGIARVIESVRDLGLLRSGEILVTSKTDPDWEPVLKLAAGIVAEKGGRTCHAAIVARELGIPAVVGADRAMSRIRSGHWITLSASEGDLGKVYDGQAKFRVERVPLQTGPGPRTRIQLILSQPDEAIRLSALPQSGVGLVRMEFLIGSAIGVHPMALRHPERVPDPEVREAIRRKSAGHADPADFFVRRLSEGVGLVASAFFPKPVIVRMSDFKASEYSNLLGGSAFEKGKEENPMLGFRGAFRYSHPLYRDGFALECEALARARMEMGLTNIAVMIPFCRTIEDAQNALAAMASHGLKREAGGLQIWMMCEIPSNVVLAEEFLTLFDGFSIGSNDLTQLILGVDRDSERMAPLFSERDPAVLRMVGEVIAKAHAVGKPVGICGQGPSDDPEFARFLVECGIDSISVNPDSLLATLPKISAFENAENERKSDEGLSNHSCDRPV